MKTVLFVFLIFVATSHYSFGQDSLNSNACSNSIYRLVKAKIPGQNSDSTIKVDSVKAGFKLIATDPSYKIVKYFIVFERGEDLVELPSTGDKIIPGNSKFGKYLNNIQAGGLMTVEGIIAVDKKGCYKLPPLVFQFTDWLEIR